MEGIKIIIFILLFFIIFILFLLSINKENYENNIDNLGLIDINVENGDTPYIDEDTNLHGKSLKYNSTRYNKSRSNMRGGRY